MIFVGELINASRKSIAEAIKTRSTETIQQLARDQAERGAAFVDVNAGVFEDQEAECPYPYGYLPLHNARRVFDDLVQGGGDEPRHN